jgi:FkbM family methyltransferase
MNTEFNKIVDTRYGKMLINENDELIGKSLEQYGEWAQSEMAFLTPYIPYGGIVADVGAYIGTHTLFFADAVGPNGIVIAFEPQQIMFQLLSANVALNHYLNVRGFCFAVDQAPGLVQIPEVDYREPNNFGSSSISQFGGYPIEARTVDGCSFPALDLLKIDVEGYEPEVITGGSQTIMMHQPFIYVKYLPDLQSEDLVQLIESFDYDVYEHDAPGYNPNNFKKRSSDFLRDYSEKNLFCVPKSKGIMVDLPLLSQ